MPGTLGSEVLASLPLFSQISCFGTQGKDFGTERKIFGTERKDFGTLNQMQRGGLVYLAIVTKINYHEITQKSFAYYGSRLPCLFLLKIRWR